MVIDYVMPKLAMAMNQGTISEWLVAQGGYVEKGQPLATIETEKVAYDVESPEQGYIHIIVKAGETVDCETLLAQYFESKDDLNDYVLVGSEEDFAEEIVSLESPVNPRMTVESVDTGSRVVASPLAKKIAADKQLDLRAISGTGPGGRIVKRDVMDALGQSTARGLASDVRPTIGSSRELARLPLAGIRKTIAERMVASLRDTAQVSAFWESDITDLMAMRNSFVAREKQLGTRVSFNAFLVKAMVHALREVPIVNSCLEGDEVVVYDNINMGFAVSVPGVKEYESSLAVAVIRNVEELGVVEIDRRMKEAAERVRTNSAGPDDLIGSTITLSSTAGLAPPGLATTPVLNSPNAGLLGSSTPIERPVVYRGEIAVRLMLPLSFTFDHRVFDGEPASRFMSALHEVLEHPELLLA